MAVPVVPILKKLLKIFVPSKKTLKTVGGILLGTLFLLLLPTLVVMGLFGEGLAISTENVNEIIKENQTLNDKQLIEIGELMTDKGFSEQRIEEAQALYMLAFFYTTEETSVKDYVDCFVMEQTDDELIARVNDEFGTEITREEFTDIVKDIREKYKEKNKKWRTKKNENRKLLRRCLRM